MEQKIKDTYEIVCMNSDKVVMSGEPKLASCIIFIGDETKSYDFELTEKNKNRIAEALKSRILQYGAKGYIIVMDTVTEKKDHNRDITIQGECMLRTLYTPELRMSEYVWYEDTRIINKDRVEGRNKMYDQWDAWNEGNIQAEPRKDIDKILKRYSKGANNGRD